MSSRPWYKRYGSDFISGTLGMTLEEKGAYSILLDLIYDRGGPIPDDARYIAGVCGCSVRKWNSIRERLIQLGKIAAYDGVISNSRADKELEISAKSADERAESGRKGGEKSAQNRGDVNENKRLGQAQLKHIRAVQKPDTRNQNSSPLAPQSGGDEADDLFDQVWSVFPQHPNSLMAQARREFTGLSAEDQAACLGGAKAFASGFAKSCAASGVSADQQRRFVKKLSTWIANRGWEGAGGDPSLAEDLVTLSPDDPDFALVERHRGKAFLLGNSGKATVKRSEIEQARKAAA